MDKKITTYFLKKIRNKEKIYIQDCEGFYLITDGMVIFKISKLEFELNPALFTNNSELKRLMYDGGYKKGFVRYYNPHHRDMLAYITDTGKDIKVCLNDKFLKLFKDCKIAIKSPVTTVLFIEDGEVVGGAMPTRISEEFELI